MSFNQSLNHLRSDLGKVRADLAKLTSELASLAQNGTQEAKENLLSQISILQERAAVLQDRMREKLDFAGEYVDKQVRANPYHTVAAISVLGLAIGLMLGSSCSRNR